MPHPPGIPSDSLIERLRTRASHRLTGIIAALLLEAGLLILLLTLGQTSRQGEPDGPALTTFDADTSPDTPDEPQPEEPEPQVQPQPRQPQPQQAPTQTAPSPLVQPAPIIPAPAPPAIPLARPNTTRPASPPAANLPAYGPPNIGGSSSTDTPRVGTAPNGEPMYAARWYREPTDGELAGYLSTAQPGWGLIACKTAPDYRVEDCVPVAETGGSQLARAVLAAAWQFKVRPPRVGGRDRIGEWVQIRIDYTQTGR